MVRLIGIIRNGDALTTRWVRQKIHLDFFEPAGVDEQAASEMGDWYEIIECPLNPLEPDQACLLASWEALRDVQELNAEILSHLRLVLNETVLGHLLPNALSLPAPTEPPSEKRVNPTAAHPRAYQGTKYKPPKEKTPPAMDLRPGLCDTKFLSSLSFNEAADAASQARLPESFRLSLYPLVRHRQEAEVVDTLALYWELDLEQRSALLAAVAYLLRLQSDANARRWCRMAAALPEEWRAPFLHLLIASGADMAEVQELPPTFPEQLAEVMSGPTPIYRLYWLLNGLVFGIALDYLLLGFHLADVYGQPYSFHAIQRSDYVPMPTLLQWGVHCGGSHNFYAGMLLRLWEQCGLRPGLGAWLEKTDWTQFAPDVAYHCLRLYATSWDNWDDLSEGQADVKWQAVRPLLGAFVAALQNVPPEFQEKCVCHLREYLWQWDTPAALQANLPTALTLTGRLCRPPFAKKCDPCEVTTDFLAELSPPLCERFLNAPDASFRRLEEACRRENDT